MLPITSYRLARINLVRAACPHELMAAVDNAAIGKPIVVEKNRNRYGYVEATDYFPEAVVVSGANLRSKMLQNGSIYGMAFVEAGAMNVTEEEFIGFGDLMGSIQSSLYRKLYGKDQPSAGHILASIEAIYPLDNYFMFRWQGREFKQFYSVGTDKKIVLNACGSAPMPLAQTGMQQGFAAPLRPPQAGVTRGGSRSELMTEIIRDWSDVNEAVNMYVNSAKTGFTRQLTPSFHPVDLKDQRKSGELVDRGCRYDGSSMKQALVKAGIDPFEFAKWSVEAQHKKTKRTGSGDDVPRGKFLYAPSSDPSTWKLPAMNESHIRNALARVNQAGIPSSARPGVLSKLRKLAKHHGIDVSDKPTKKQKHWAAVGVIA